MNINFYPQKQKFILFNKAACFGLYDHIKAWVYVIEN